MTTADTSPGSPGVEAFDPLSPRYLADPFAVLAALPAGEPVFYAPSIGYYVVTRYADIEQVFRDPQTYSAAVAQAPLVPLVPEAQQILLAGGTNRSRRWSASTSPRTHDCASPRPARSA
jgi:cytochrome P450